MIVFIDETGFSFQALLGSTWAPCGRPPLLRRVSAQRRGFSTIIGLTLAGRIFKQHQRGSIRSPHVLRFLRHVLRHQATPLIVVWDRASIHRAKIVTTFLAEHPQLDVEWLPKCAPELNPEELCHGNVKARIRNLTPKTVTEYRQHVDRGFARLRQRPDLLLGFCRHAQLHVNQLW